MGGLEWLAWLTEFEPSSGPAPYAALAAVGSKLSIAWIRGPFLGQMAVHLWWGLIHLLLLQRKSFLPCWHCGLSVMSIGMIGCVPWPICLHSIA